nr:5'-adenylylsulfate reductase 3, chloroplastic-like isoform X1 [Tanacetum cinerariifolium]
CLYSCYVLFHVLLWLRSTTVIAKSSLREPFSITYMKRQRACLPWHPNQLLMDRVFEKYENYISISFRFSGLYTGRLNPETYKFFHTHEKHYGIQILYVFSDAVKV